MVTSNKLPDKKVFKMSDQNSNRVVPQRTLLENVNAQLTCSLCRGYYIDATTIVECLHSFCRSCIIKHLQDKKYCPVCGIMINSAKPNIKPDKALQDIVYKLVPGLFQREMERRQQFYASRPGPAASATPEQRGEDTERIIFSPEDVISFSLEYVDATDTDSISSKSSDSNEKESSAPRRYLQCPAVVNISHLKKFLSMKFDIDSRQFAIDILYKRVPLSDYYTLMDIAYIYNWKRNEPMRFFYQIIDYSAIRNRYGLFDRKGSHFHDKSSPAPADDTNGPAPHLHDQGSEASSGTDSPMPDDNNGKKCSSGLKINERQMTNKKDGAVDKETASSSKKCDEDAEKSQFLNSFELTAKSSSGKSPNKMGNDDGELPKANEQQRENMTPQTSKMDDSPVKRKHTSNTESNSPDNKKSKFDNDKKISLTPNKIGIGTSNSKTSLENVSKNKEDLSSKEQLASATISNSSNSETKMISTLTTTQTKLIGSESRPPLKRPVPGSQSLYPTKYRVQEVNAPTQKPEQKSVSPIKIQLPKTITQPPANKSTEFPKPILKKMPELKLGVPLPQPQINQNKVPIVNKMRMDLLANNCDPTMDRSKILPHVKTLAPQGPRTPSGDPLKSLFDSCKINIPSSLSITLTDQKLDSRNQNELMDLKRQLLNKANTIPGTNNMSVHKIPSPPSNNTIEILRLPEVDQKKGQNKPENHTQAKSNANKKPEMSIQAKPSNLNRPPDTPSPKGPIPSLKPIGETKLAKQDRGMFPMTSPYQEKYIQSLEQSEKFKLPKNKMQVPNLMPANPKILNTVNKEGTNKPGPSNSIENKSGVRSDNVLDLSTSHIVQSQLGPQQTKTLETMQSIANLANKQTLPNKGVPTSMHQTSPYTSMANHTITSESSPIRIPNVGQVKCDMMKTFGSPSIPTLNRQDNKPNPMKHLNTSIPKSAPPPNYQNPQMQYSPSQAPSPRQTRSPSSSPKLVIAEDNKHPGSITEIGSGLNQSNQISSTQFCNIQTNNMDPSKMPPGPSKVPPGPSKIPPGPSKIPPGPSKVPPGPSKVPPKPMKPISAGIRLPIPCIMKPGTNMSNPTDMLLQQQMQGALLKQYEWLKNQQARQQYENLLKNMTNAAAMHQNQKDFNKDGK